MIAHAYRSLGIAGAMMAAMVTLDRANTEVVDKTPIKPKRIPTKGAAPQGLYGYSMDKPLTALTIEKQSGPTPSRQVRRQLERLRASA
ncbi:hypothetical protein [Mesorhizobium sp. M0767]|uniref:hypothetical protein n=1 Tax=Mesorhizobium sp. M0767 TaxID=2956995 RepID=UPI00333AF6C3